MARTCTREEFKILLLPGADLHATPCLTGKSERGSKGAWVVLIRKQMRVFDRVLSPNFCRRVWFSVPQLKLTIARIRSPDFLALPESRNAHIEAVLHVQGNGI
jgi:hypothetical protein